MRKRFSVERLGQNFLSKFFYGVFCMWVVGGMTTTTVQKLWCFSQREAISHYGIPNLKRSDKTCSS
jgi:hypothetical protein